MTGSAWRDGAGFAMLSTVLVDDIKKQITEAMKSGDAVARDVLRLALSEIETAEARKNAPVSEEDAINAVRKLIKSNEETLGLTADSGARGDATTGDSASCRRSFRSSSRSTTSSSRSTRSATRSRPRRTTVRLRASR